MVRSFFRFGFTQNAHFLHVLIWSACAFVTYSVWVTLERENGRRGFQSEAVAAGTPQRFLPGKPIILATENGNVVVGRIPVD